MTILTIIIIEMGKKLVVEVSYLSSKHLYSDAYTVHIMYCTEYHIVMTTFSQIFMKYYRMEMFCEALIIIVRFCEFAKI